MFDVCFFIGVPSSSWCRQYF